MLPDLGIFKLQLLTLALAWLRSATLILSQQRGPGMVGGATGAVVPPTAALAAAFCFNMVQSKV